MGGVKRQYEDGDLPEVSDEAFANLFDAEVDNQWLASAAPDEQAAAMVRWFRARFCDPAEETPYMSSEGGYLWVHGGPYDATEEIQGRFDGVATPEAIEHAIDAVEADGIFDWAPTSLTYLDDLDDDQLDNRNEPTRRLEDRIENVLGVMNLDGHESKKETARNLVFAGVIAALESFLQETMFYWVSNREEVVKEIITKHPKFKDQKFSLGEIYEIRGALEKQVKLHLKKVVWHRVDDVVSLFKHGLDVDIGFHRFKGEIATRHDILHRFSQDSNGDQVSVSDQEIRDLALKIISFANEIDAKIAGIFAPEAGESVLDLSGF